MPLTRKELINGFITFFKLKKHKQIINASLIPENDPTVLFTTAGMHPLVPYILGQDHPQGKRLVNVQKCIRTGDIDLVGDTYHHTFFEMLGNWSLGDYWKTESHHDSFSLLTRGFKVPVDKLAVTFFAGDKNAPRDEESAEIWKHLGIKRIGFVKDDNWWGPAGETGPCGPDVEIMYWVSKMPVPEKYNPNDKNWVEIKTDVLMEYNKTKDGKFESMKRKVIDVGMGVERTLAVLQGIKDDYMTEIFKPAIKEVEYLSEKRYGFNQDITKAMRIITDHIRAAVFILAEGIEPSNLEQGYVLRRLIRRAIRYGKKINVEGNFCKKLAKVFIKYYGDYPNLRSKESFILDQLEKEEIRFKETLDKGLKEFVKMSKDKKIDGKEAFLLYQSYGFPFEMTKELAKEKGVSINEEEFRKELESHKELSRTATKGRFKSGLADHSDKTRKLHTAAHLLVSALKYVLKQDIHQKGSNITPERLRFDFNFPRKLTEQETEKVENRVNDLINKGLVVIKEEMSINEAKKRGAHGDFSHKYSGKVSVYTICEKGKDVYSCEICAGPHVNNIKELGTLKITKQESVGAGTRRIKAILI
ncbi:MAG: alanine--tRNA ligase [archaeon]|nr:MAG: alanine--tRNA ligase [archaeon]